MRKLYLIKAKMSRFFYYKCIIPCDFLSGQRFSIVLFGQKKPPQLPFSGKSAMAFLLIIIIRQRPSIFSAIVDGCYKCVNGGTDDIRVYTCAPCHGAVWLLDSNIGNGLGTGAAL